MKTEPALAAAVYAAIEHLETKGPALGRPLADRIKGSRHRQMKELRPRSGSRVAIRILFAFDPARQAILLVSGNKANDWKGWYEIAIPEADAALDRWLEDHRDGPRRRPPR
jgi:hypothetical protein